MPRFKMVNSERVQLTDEEETTREAEEKEWVDNKSTRAFVSLRRKRNAMLVSSDWTQYNDSPLSDEAKTSWATYRQELRDLPATTYSRPDGDGALVIEPTWPEVPE